MFLRMMLMAMLAVPVMAQVPAGVTNTQNKADIPLSPQESLKRITVPEGFNVTLFAGEPDVYQPIAFCFDDRNRLWVVENFSHPVWRNEGKDRIVILEDTDFDGAFDKRKVFFEGGRYFSGIEFGFGGVYVCNVPELIFIPDSDRDDVPDVEPQVLLDGWATRSPHNVINNLTWGPDGWLYGCVGQNGGSKVGKPGTPAEDRIAMSRGIWRYHPVRHEFEVVAHGAVNPWGLAFNEMGEGFFSNCVLPHLWHLMPGSYYQRRRGERDNPYAYGRIQPIPDHIHWGGGRWTSSRGGEGLHGIRGGGHAHTGAMIYYGDNWPKKYRGTYFVGNIHGNRINNDTLHRNGSTFVAKHSDDFLLADDKWFRTLSQKYGANGEVYVTDWHDYGECHDNDGTHLTSGRIYRITHDKVEAPHWKDLNDFDDLELMMLLQHPNRWYVDRARRILQERAAAGKDLSQIVPFLKKFADGGSSKAAALAAVQTLWLTGNLDWKGRDKLMQSENEWMRIWGIRMMTDDKSRIGPAVLRMMTMTRLEKSRLVLHHLASAVPRFELKHRWILLEELSRRHDLADDPALPLMIWYAIEPLFKEEYKRALILCLDSNIPLLWEYGARRVCEADIDWPNELFMQMYVNDAPEYRNAILSGMADALEGRGAVEATNDWDPFYQSIKASGSPGVAKAALRVAALFNAEGARDDMRAIIMDMTVSADARIHVIESLAERGDDGIENRLLKLLEDKEVRLAAIKALAHRPHADAAKRLVALYASLTKEEQQAAVQTLASRADSAALLLKSEIPKSDIPLLTVQQMNRFEDEALRKELKKIWGTIEGTSEEKKKLIAEWRAKLTPDFMAQADKKAGKVIFTQRCGSCHTLFGEGGKLGPDLTGSGRADLSYVLENVLDPGALVSKEYQLTNVLMKDGRIISGMQRGQNAESMSFDTLSGLISLQRSDVRSLRLTEQSMMPEGLLQGLSDEQVRDLIAYLGREAAH